MKNTNVLLRLRGEIKKREAMAEMHEQTEDAEKYGTLVSEIKSIEFVIGLLNRE